MKPTEFYQKYWRIKTASGPVAPELTERECKFLDDMISGKMISMRMGRLGRTITVDVDLLREEMKKLPEFFKNENRDTIPGEKS